MILYIFPANTSGTQILNKYNNRTYIKVLRYILVFCSVPLLYSIYILFWPCKINSKVGTAKAKKVRYTFNSLRYRTNLNWAQFRRYSIRFLSSLYQYQELRNFSTYMASFIWFVKTRLRKKTTPCICPDKGMATLQKNCQRLWKL